MRHEIQRLDAFQIAPGVDLMRAFFRETAFSPHRHDTYAVGVTEVGVQSFMYRGIRHDSLASTTFVLHPDELHDGRAGDDRGFGYAIAYIDPAIIRAILGVRPLPFIRDPLRLPPGVCAAISNIVAEWRALEEPLALDSAMTQLAEALWMASLGSPEASCTPDIRSAFRIREFLTDTGASPVSIEDLCVATGLSRWQLTRRFQQVFGVSPYRYHLMRRLDAARRLLSFGGEPAQVALDCGFADQAHLTRHFRKAFGLSPGVWKRSTTTPVAQPISTRSVHSSLGPPKPLSLKP